MKKVITEFYCDLCGNLVERDAVMHHIDFPRRVKIMAKDGHGRDIMRWDDIKIVPTDMCSVCARTVASCFPEIEDIQEDDYWG